MKSLNLFFSYGHDETTKNLILLIKQFFENRGHKVWIDKNAILEGSDWRRAIIDGLENSNTVLAFLSQRAIGKKNGVCLDELRISVTIPGVDVVSVLLEEESSLEIPCTISRNQYIDMSDWRGVIDAPAWGQYFNEKMERLAEVLESEEHFKLQGEINLIKNFLIPDISENKYYSLLSVKQIGRENASMEFDNWLTGKERILFISGKPGCGKSHFVAHKAHYNPDVLGIYFFEFDNEATDSIKLCIRTLCFQIASKLPDFRHWIIKEFNLRSSNNKTKTLTYFNKSTEKELFMKLIVAPFFGTIYGNQGNKCIILDAIDELPQEQMNSFIKLIIDDTELKTPEWVKFVISCRSKEKLEKYFQKHEVIEMDSSERVDDIKEYMNFRLEGKLSDEDLEKIAGKSEGMFIYAEKFCDAYLSEMITLDKIPAGISNLYYLYFDKIFSDRNFSDYALPLTVIVCDTRNAVTEELFLKILGWKNTELAEFLDMMRAFVSVDNTRERQLRFCHKSMAEWITSKQQSGKFYIDIKAGHKFLCDFCEAELKKTSYDYQTMRLIYTQLKQYGSGEQKALIRGNYKFLYDLMYEAHVHSDVMLFEDIHGIIKDAVEFCIDNSDMAKYYYCKAYFLNCQLEYIKGEVNKCREYLEKGRVKFKEYLEKDLEIRINADENYIWTIKDIQQETAEKMINELIEYVSDKQFNNKPTVMSNLYYLKGVILYKVRDLDGSWEALHNAKRIAENLMVDPANNLIRIANQLGWVCYQLDKYNEAVEHFTQSLDMRIKEYGTYNHYTALAYDALARGYLLKSEREGIQLSENVKGYALKALSINNVLFGEGNRHSARNLHTLSMISERLNKNGEAIEYVNMAYEIYEKHCDGEGMERMQEYLDELMKK